MSGGKDQALAQVVSYLNGMVRFQALTIAELMLVVQMFVRERCDNEPIEAAKLEAQWNALAKQFHEHSEWLRHQNESMPDAD